jgi:hypothetical protein
MRDSDRAFPVLEEATADSDGSPCTDYVLTSRGMTLRQYAAIHLKVPQSGDPDIDAMIRKSRMADRNLEKGEGAGENAAADEACGAASQI